MQRRVNMTAVLGHVSLAGALFGYPLFCLWFNAIMPYWKSYIPYSYSFWYLGVPRALVVMWSMSSLVLAVIAAAKRNAIASAESAMSCLVAAFIWLMVTVAMADKVYPDFIGATPGSRGLKPIGLLSRPLPTPLPQSPAINRSR